MSNTFYNTRFGSISLSKLFEDEKTITFECYDELDKYYGYITFNKNERIPTDKSVDFKLAQARA